MQFLLQEKLLGWSDSIKTGVHLRLKNQDLWPHMPL